MDKPADQKQVGSGSNLYRRLICGEVAGDVLLDEDQAPCSTPTTSVRSAIDNLSHEVGFSSGPGEYVRDTSSILSLQPWIFKRETKLSGNSECEMNDFPNASFCEISPRSVSIACGSARGRSSLRSRRACRRPIRTLGSMENCLIPQLYSDVFDMEEFVFSSLSTPTTVAVRPFIITDGKKIISKSGYKHLAVPFENALDDEISGARSRISEPVVGVSPLFEPRKPKRSRDAHHGRISAIDSQRLNKHSHPQGLLDGSAIYSFGICVGVLFSALSNKRETEKLNVMLKRTENLVQDLQDELEMKNSITVKELPHDTCGKQEDIEGLEQLRLPKLESISKIEAELEAELERLELNMNPNSLQGRMSELVEVDADIGDAVHGELRADILDWKWRDESDGDHDQDSKSSLKDCTDDPNHPISPRELALRLHEVNRQRLEERIKELETVLARSQKQLQLMEAEDEPVLSERVFSNSDMGSSSNQESPKGSTSREGDAFVQPFCLNLSGDALNAYDEAYEEFIRITDTTNAKEKPDWNESSYSADSSSIWEQDHFLKSKEPNVAHDESDGDGDGDDEFKLLIQQIVERTRRGSPVMIQAQRMLCSGDY